VTPPSPFYPATLIEKQAAPDEYNQMALAASESQIAKAGYHLAALMNLMMGK